MQPPGPMTFPAAFRPVYGTAQVPQEDRVGTISSGIGLISGFDYQTLIARLMSIEARPRDQLLARIGSINAQRTAYADISARVAALLTRANALSLRSAFAASRATSSKPDVLSATVSNNAAPGSYSFIVRALASTQQVISRGYADSGATLSAGTLTLESGRARVNNRTRLEELNGYAGVRRGSIRLTDGQGRSATVNINEAATLADVVERIHAAGLNITAAVRNDRLVLTETTGGALRIQEVDGGRTAADLGFRGGNTGGTGTLTGDDLMVLSGITPLASLNDGNGVHRAKAGGDFTINGMTVDLSGVLTDSTRLERLNHGQGVVLGRIRITTVDDEGSRIPVEVDLSGLKTVGEIKRKIEEAVPGLSVALTGSRLTVGYADSSKTRLLKIEDVGGSAARNLGIDGSSDLGRISGREVLVIDRVADVLAAINHADGNDGTIRAALRGKRLEISAGGADVTLAAVAGSSALEHLGFEAATYRGTAAGHRIIGAVDSILLRTLNGGRGVRAGTILIESSAGGSATIDLGAAESLQQVIDLINEGAARSGLSLLAEYDRTGTRLVVASTDGSTLTISDETGDFAESTGLYRTDQSEIRSNNLQRQYVSQATLLSELNAGNGVRLGEIRVSDSKGISRTINLAEGGPRTLGDIIGRLNSEAKDGGLGILARINDTGDGLLIEDTAGGELTLKVEDLSGSSARDLNLLRAATDGRIDGSYETRIQVSANETLAGLATRINQAGPLASASILYDGNPINPYRLQIASSRPGLAGELVIDETGIGLDLAVLTRAQDARLILGNDAEHGVLITSSSNTIANVVPGLTVTLNGVSDGPVTVTVNQEVKAAIEALEGLATAFNALMDRIKELAGYNKSTEKAGILLGESTVRAVENRIFRLVTGTVPGAPGGLQRLSEVGLRLEAGKLSFDADKFQKALAGNPDGVIEFFTQEKTGAAAWIKQQIEAITGSEGLISRRAEALGRKTEVLKQRVAALNELLDRKQQRLTRQFNALERALAELQSQQTALAQLASLAGGFSLPRGTGQG